MKRSIACALVSVAVLMGCAATQPTQEQAKVADYGPVPTDARGAIHQYMQHFLKDPGSASYQILNVPFKGYFSAGSGIVYGHIVCANVNAKNSFGGYTGNQLHYFILRGDLVMEHVGWDEMTRALRLRCAGVTA